MPVEENRRTSGKSELAKKATEIMSRFGIISGETNKQAHYCYCKIPVESGRGETSLLHLLVKRKKENSVERTERKHPCLPGILQQ